VLLVVVLMCVLAGTAIGTALCRRRRDFRNFP
jgi:hypothetical protein